MHKTVTIKSMFTSVVAGVSLVLAAAPAFALSVPASAGLPALSADAACLAASVGKVTNNCGRQVVFTIPMAVNQGPKTVSLSTNNPGGGTFDCILFAMTQFGAVSGAPGSTVFPNVGNQVNQLSNTVPASGSLFVRCDINPGGTIFNINYNQ